MKMKVAIGLLPLQQEEQVQTRQFFFLSTLPEQDSGSRQLSPWPQLTPKLMTGLAPGGPVNLTRGPSLMQATMPVPTRSCWVAGDADELPPRRRSSLLRMSPSSSEAKVAVAAVGSLTLISTTFLAGDTLTRTVCHRPSVRFSPRDLTTLASPATRLKVRLPSRLILSCSSSRLSPVCLSSSPGVQVRNDRPKCWSPPPSGLRGVDNKLPDTRAYEEALVKKPSGPAVARTLDDAAGVEGAPGRTEAELIAAAAVAANDEQRTNHKGSDAGKEIRRRGGRRTAPVCGLRDLLVRALVGRVRG